MLEHNIYWMAAYLKPWPCYVNIHKTLHTSESDNSGCTATIVRPHRSTMHTDAAFCYRWGSIVCLSVGWSVCHDCKPVQKRITDRHAIWNADSGGSGGGGLKEPSSMYYTKVQNSQSQMATLKGKSGGPLSVMTCAKTTELIEMPIWMWTWVGPRKHALDGVHIGTTRQIRLNRPRAAAMRPFVKLLWPLTLHCYMVAKININILQSIQHNSNNSLIQHTFSTS